MVKVNVRQAQVTLGRMIYKIIHNMHLSISDFMFRYYPNFLAVNGREKHLRFGKSLLVGKPYLKVKINFDAQPIIIIVIKIN